MPSCVFRGCTNYTATVREKKNVSFHVFPKDKLLKEKWLQKIRTQRREDDWMPSTYSTVCSVHFLDSDVYMTENNIRRLKKTAVPVIKIKESQPATTSTENDGKSTNFPGCDECKRPVDARELYRCVQCPLVVMCADCGRSNAHAHHCVLRMPSLKIYNKVEYLFELLTDVFHKKLSEEDVDNIPNDDGDDGDDDKDHGSDNDDNEEEMEQELEISVRQEGDCEDQNQKAESAVPGPSKKRMSSASTFLSLWRNEASTPEPPGEAIPTSRIKTEPDTDPLACPQLFNVLHKTSDEPKPKKQRIINENAPKEDNSTELYTDEIIENIKIKEEHEEIVEVKLEPLDNDAALLDTEKYASYGSHRAGNTGL